MIESVSIQNFKSIVDLNLELGSFNVLIGANGSGKSNILEALAFGGAAVADKLDHEFLGSRGIRMTRPEFMYSAFPGEKKVVVNLNFKGHNSENQHLERPIELSISEDGTGWIDNIIQKVFHSFRDAMSNPQMTSSIFEKNQLQISQEEAKEFEKIAEMANMAGQNTNIFYLGFRNGLIQALLQKDTFMRQLGSFLTYAPTESALRTFSDTNQIYPLGIHGEGLFQYLKSLSEDKEKRKLLKKIQQHLALVEWFDQFNVPKGLMSNEYTLSIRDRYLDPTLKSFDQKSTNEGFLFLLFYFTLFLSPDTPAFFAIDNIDTALNPKMCRELVRQLAILAKKQGKQVIVTTHNPAILDGLDLSDDSQRLFVVRRNDEGHTKADRIPHKKDRTMRLSELWMNGYIGGLPDNF